MTITNRYSSIKRKFQTSQSDLNTITSLENRNTNNKYRVDMFEQNSCCFMNEQVLSQNAVQLNVIKNQITGHCNTRVFIGSRLCFMKNYTTLQKYGKRTRIFGVFLFQFSIFGWRFNKIIFPLAHAGYQSLASSCASLSRRSLAFRVTWSRRFVWDTSPNQLTVKAWEKMVQERASLAIYH